MREKIPNDEDLASAAIASLRQAQDELRSRMEARGLTLEKGWRIRDELRHVVGGTRWTFHAVHLRQTTPPDMEATVLIDEHGRVVEG